MDKYLWMAVTPDKYELPIAVADTARELSRMLGSNNNLVSKQYCQHNKNKSKKWTKYKIVKIKVGKGKP